MAPDKATEPISVDTKRPYVVITWAEDGAMNLQIGGGITYDHLIVAGFMVSRQAMVTLDDMQMRQMMAQRGGDGGLLPFASIPETLKRGS